MKLAVVTACCYSTEEPIWMLRRSCDIFKIPLVTYGLHDPDNDWISVKVTRLLRMATALRRMGHTHMLYTDGRDTFFTGPLKEIEMKYQAMGSPPMFMSGERKLFPASEELGQYFADPGTPYRYPNCGGFITELQWFIDHYTAMIALCGAVERNDQAWVIWAYANRHMGGMQLDTDCLIFQTMSDSTPEDFTISKGVFRNAITGTLPNLLHFNGGYMDPINGRVETMMPVWLALGMDMGHAG